VRIVVIEGNEVGVVLARFGLENGQVAELEANLQGDVRRVFQDVGDVALGRGIEPVLGVERCAVVLETSALLTFEVGVAVGGGIGSTDAELVVGCVSFHDRGRAHGASWPLAPDHGQEEQRCRTTQL